MPKTEWKGRSFSGEKEIVDGVMYWNGTICMVLNMKPGLANISIEARKFLVIQTDDPGNRKFYPYMIVKLDDEEIGETFVSNDDWQKYLFSVRTNGGFKVLSVEFTNDVYDTEKGEDRNLAAGDVNISYR